MQTLTTRQLEVLACIQKYFAKHGIPPTIAEIAIDLEIRSPNAVRDHLRALERKGAIELIPSASRGIRLLGADHKNPTQLQLPLVGHVAAGSPILAEQHIDSYQQVDPALFKPQAHYLLRVHGESMQNIGILDGDLLAVHKTAHVENNQIVVARIDDEVTVKRFKKRGHIAYLHPENDQFSPIKIDLRDTSLCIEGIGVGVIRNTLS